MEKTHRIELNQQMMMMIKTTLLLLIFHRTMARSTLHTSEQIMEPSSSSMDMSSHSRFAKQLAVAQHAIEHTTGESKSFGILPRENLPDGFGSKVAFQTVKSKNAKGDEIVTERLIRCGIEKYEDGSDVFPCNPSFDTRPYVKGLDHLGTGFDALTGERRAPLFEWSVPAWYKPAYDSAKYNYDVKIPEQILLTAIPSGEGGMVTELFSNFDEFESKSSFVMDIGFGAMGANVGFSMSKESQRYRSAFDEFEIGVSKQKYKVYQLSLKKDIYGTCPYNEAVFAAEKDTVNTASGRESPSDGQVAEWKAADCAKWAREAKLPESFAKKLEELKIPGPLLVSLSDDELNELGIETAFMRHKFHYELEVARKKETEEAVTIDVGGGSEDTGIIGEVPTVTAVTVVDEGGEGGESSINSAETQTDDEGAVGSSKDENEESIHGTDFAHPRYLRKYIMRQAFIDAVNSLPVFSERQINNICPFFDSEREKQEEELRMKLLEAEDDAVSRDDPVKGKDSRESQYRRRDYDPTEDSLDDISTMLTPASAAAVERYRRFLHDWGTHFATAVTFGGEVEVTTMIRKSTTEARSEDTVGTETKIEHDETQTEEKADEDSEDKTVIETDSSSGGEEGDGEEVPAQPSSSTHQTTTSSSTKKSEQGAMSALRGALISLADGGASQMIKEAIKNLELKLNLKTSKTTKQKSILTSENNKNELRFKGGDTTVDPEQIGGSQFAAWKDTIPENPAAIEKTLSPITELVLAYAGPNAGEQCPSMEVHKRISRVAQMLECMTRKILREGRDLADTVYELGQIDMKKSQLGRELESMVKKCGNSADNSNSACQAQLKRITQEWQQVCGIRMTLMAKRDRQHADLFAFTHKFPTNAPDANTNYNKVCERELSRITSGKQSRIISQVTRMDKKTGRERTDRCALCMAVHDNAKCLATRKECGPRGQQVMFDTTEMKEKIKEYLGEKCDLNAMYKNMASDALPTGALPSAVKKWIENKDMKHWKASKSTWQGNTGWMGWSAVLFGPDEVLCDKVSNQIVCHDFLRRLRETHCTSAGDETGQHVRRSALISALDFGARGETPDSTTSRSACECAGFCVPEIEARDKWELFYESNTERGWASIALSNAINKDGMRIQYEESLIRDELQTCVARKPQPTPETLKHVAPYEETKAWMKKRRNNGPLQCEIGVDVSEKLQSYFTSKVAYIGHCIPGSFCFSLDEMNQGDNSKLELWVKGPSNDPDTPTLTVTDIDHSDPDAAERRKNQYGEGALGPLIHFRAWGKSANNLFARRGIVYAEMVMGGKGLPKLIVVVSGLPKPNEPNFFSALMRKFTNSIKDTLSIAGPNLDDPRKILVAEDRVGNSIGGRDDEGYAHGSCAWLYHICCAMGGTLHQDTQNPNYGTLSKQCPAGTVCCPPAPDMTDNPLAVPWTYDSVKLLWTLSHGRLKGAPHMNMDDSRQGWKTQDPISATGANQCVGLSKDKVRKMFHTEVRTDMSRTEVERRRKEDSASTVDCVFTCQKKKRDWAIFHGSEKCKLRSGGFREVTIQNVAKGKCKSKVDEAKKQCIEQKEKCDRTPSLKEESPTVV